MYLNDVAAGGATRFERLDVAVTPRAGRAVLFFPAFADGSPDARCGARAAELDISAGACAASRTCKCTVCLWV